VSGDDLAARDRVELPELGEDPVGATGRERLKELPDPSLWYLFFLELGRRYVAGDRTIKLDYGVVSSRAGGAHFGEGTLELVAPYKIASATE
jgi:hypothetical protein